ncbi:hypothetical protein H920_10123 [Fukomys damarensis]|uniref:Uncharacterized protein n=1 Tax=Fukomys damarensis TaxID=885580 RepID=A0A091DB37_FUKDA|nr:hypothetical protein H920_10123 [Fukomys damarensis]
MGEGKQKDCEWPPAHLCGHHWELDIAENCCCSPTWHSGRINSNSAPPLGPSKEEVKFYPRQGIKIISLRRFPEELDIEDLHGKRVCHNAKQCSLEEYEHRQEEETLCPSGPQVAPHMHTSLSTCPCDLSTSITRITHCRGSSCGGCGSGCCKPVCCCVPVCSCSSCGKGGCGSCGDCKPCCCRSSCCQFSCCVPFCCQCKI